MKILVYQCYGGVFSLTKGTARGTGTKGTTKGTGSKGTARGTGTKGTAISLHILF